MRVVTNSNSGSADAFFIDTKGQIGIGTNNPIANLDVHGTANFSRGINLVNFTNYLGWSNTISFQDQTGNQRHLITDQFDATSSNNGHLLIIPGGYPYPGVGGGVNVVDLWGNLNVFSKVTIGTVPTIASSSSLDNNYMLYVAKGIITEKVKVALTDGGNWSDYVFDQNYTLTPLADVESYIKAHKHLPGVPSADDVCEDGIDMALMDATLLKKIEELTLYVLELKKENQEIKSQIVKK